MLTFSPVPTLAVGPISLSTHGLLIAAGFLVALLLALRAVKSRGLAVAVAENMALIAVVAGLIGARLAYILTMGNTMTPLQMLKVWEGGLSSHGGYLAGIIAAVAYLKYKKVAVVRYTDAMMPYLLVGWAIGRIGCLLNWDSFGTVTTVPWALVVYGVPHHATQIYESLGYLVSFGIVWSLAHFDISIFRNIARPGFRTAIPIALFALTRFIVDFFRADPVEYLRFSRIITVLLFISALGLIVRAIKRSK